MLRVQTLIQHRKYLYLALTNNLFFCSLKFTVCEKTEMKQKKNYCSLDPDFLMIKFPLIKSSVIACINLKTTRKVFS